MASTFSAGLETCIILLLRYFIAPAAIRVQGSFLQERLYSASSSRSARIRCSASSITRAVSSGTSSWL